VRGLLHVHSRMSDGRGTLDEIAAAAARAGLQFLVVTDHGDGTRKPEPPSYRSGVLMIDAVEISTRDGHYLAIGLPQSPYPLGGAAADVVDSRERLLEIQRATLASRLLDDGGEFLDVQRHPRGTRENLINQLMRHFQAAGPAPHQVGDLTARQPREA